MSPFEFIFFGLLLVGTVACPLVSLLVVRRLTSSIKLSLADSEKLRSQLVEMGKVLSARVRVSEETASDLLTQNRKLIEANLILGSDAHKAEVDYLRGQHAYLQSSLYESAHTAQRRILELASSSAAEGERRAALGRDYRPPFEDGFRPLPPDSSPVDTLRVPSMDRENPARSSILPVPPPIPTPPEASEFYRAASGRSPSSPAFIPSAPFTPEQEVDVDAAFRSPPQP